MKHKFLPVCALCLLLASCAHNQRSVKTAALKDAFKDKFFIGTAMNGDQIWNRDTLGVSVIKQHFSAIVPENCMKSMYLQPEQGKFFFDEADQFVKFGEENGMFVTGHCLVWHSQAPSWFFVDKNSDFVSRDTLLARIKNHITVVVSRYKGRIKGWDAVNEAIMEDGSWRQSPFYKIIGADFIDSAFTYAHAADPNAELYYNDYAMAGEGKRNAVVSLIKSLKKKGIRIDGVGMQGHCGMNHPDFAEEEKSIVTFAETGVKVMITELDMSVLPTPEPNESADISLNFDYRKEINPYTAGLPADIDSIWTNRYAALFEIFLKHSDKISRVTTWGTGDANSWRNNWPVAGRTDYPLLFDRHYQAKPIVTKLIKLTENKK